MSSSTNRAAAGSVVLNQRTGSTSRGGGYVESSKAVTTAPPPPAIVAAEVDDSPVTVDIDYGPAPALGSRVMTSDVLRFEQVPESYWEAQGCATPADWKAWLKEAELKGQYHDPTGTVLLPGAGKTRVRGLNDYYIGEDRAGLGDEPTLRDAVEGHLERTATPAEEIAIDGSWRSLYMSSPELAASQTFVGRNWYTVERKDGSTGHASREAVVAAYAAVTHKSPEWVGSAFGDLTRNHTEDVAYVAELKRKVESAASTAEQRIMFCAERGELDPDEVRQGMEAVAKAAAKHALVAAEVKEQGERLAKEFANRLTGQNFD